MRVRVVGRGRAGGSFAGALRSVGVSVDLIAGRTPSIDAHDVDLVLLCVPDDAILTVAARVVTGDAVLAHCAGSRTLAELGEVDRRASIHPLMSLPDAERGAELLTDDCTFAVAGDPIAQQVVALLGGRAIEVPDERRGAYHAAACVAANHLVVLTAQVERLAAHVGIPPDAYWVMMRRALDNVERVGAIAALTGPAARGDVATVSSHIDALPAAERLLYTTLSDAAAELAGRTSVPEVGAPAERSSE